MVSWREVGWHFRRRQRRYALLAYAACVGVFLYFDVTVLESLFYGALLYFVCSFAVLAVGAVGWFVQASAKDCWTWAKSLRSMTQKERVAAIIKGAGLLLLFGLALTLNYWRSFDPN